MSVCFFNTPNINKPRAYDFHKFSVYFWTISILNELKQKNKRTWEIFLPDIRHTKLDTFLRRLSSKRGAIVFSTHLNKHLFSVAKPWKICIFFLSRIRSFAKKKKKMFAPIKELKWNFAFIIRKKPIKSPSHTNLCIIYLFTPPNKQNKTKKIHFSLFYDCTSGTIIITPNNK